VVDMVQNILQVGLLLDFVVDMVDKMEFQDMVDNLVGTD
jgi:hypothetical protein